MVPIEKNCFYMVGKQGELEFVYLLTTMILQRCNKV